MIGLANPDMPARQIDPTVPRGILGDEPAVCRWVAVQLGFPPDHYDNCPAIGIVYQDRPIAGVVFTNYVKFPSTGLATVSASIASTTPRWATRPILRAIFRYAFLYLGCVRLQTVCCRDDKAVRRFNERLGFKMEGIGRRAWDGRKDCVCFSMLPHECRFLTDEDKARLRERGN